MFHAEWTIFATCHEYLVVAMFQRKSPVSPNCAIFPCSLFEPPFCVQRTSWRLFLSAVGIANESKEYFPEMREQEHRLNWFSEVLPLYFAVSASQYKEGKTPLILWLWNWRTDCSQRYKCITQCHVAKLYFSWGKNRTCSGFPEVTNPHKHQVLFLLCRPDYLRFQGLPADSVIWPICR